MAMQMRMVEKPNFDLCLTIFDPTWFVPTGATRFRCLCFLIRDLRADSRFDIILLRFRSSIFRFESFKTGFSFGSPEPELEVGLGLVGLKGEKMLGKFHGVTSSSNTVKSELEREESMVIAIAKVKSGERKEGEREETLMKGLIFKDVLQGYSR
ncbi:hypothetical protein L195_g024193 [Trifolium pratense]|uniref:Uncharacterized protein n=1 Tax=Trifolium pratense TaxID=57577 RepID=A0A2K3NCY7_TRIPR|nr:hypothetical protein L195_g024193 [Trifolium pratense]